MYSTLDGLVVFKTTLKKIFFTKFNLFFTKKNYLSVYLKTGTYSFQLLLRHFHLPSRHVHRLFGIKRISDASRYEDVKLDPRFPFFFFSFLLILRKRKSLVSTIECRSACIMNKKLLSNFSLQKKLGQAKHNFIICNNCSLTADSPFVV